MKKRKKKNILMGIGVVVVLIIIVFILKSKKAPVEYESATVDFNEIKKTINVDLTVEPAVYTDVSSELPTLIDKVYVQIGDEVEKGQKLIKLNQQSISAQINNARLAVERAELSEQQARRQWDRLKPEERESLKKASEQARQSLNEVYAQASKTVITSAIDGIIIKQEAREGEIAQGIILTIIQPETLRAEALIPEIDISKIQKGSLAEIVFDAYADQVYSGKIASIEQGSTVIQNNNYYKAIINLNNLTDVKLLEGMNAEADILIEKKDNVLTVPRDFAFKDENGYFVYLVNSQKSVKKPVIKKYFQEGLIGDEFVEILSGLENGLVVVQPNL
jgi:HlyD family secretion protein